MGSLSEGIVRLVHWSEEEAPERAARLERLGYEVEATGEGVLWIAWSKGSSAITTDLAEGAVRASGPDAGLVDSKICAIDEGWSGLRFTRRRS